MGREIREINTLEDTGKYDINQDLKNFLLDKANTMLGGNCLLIVYKFNEVLIGSINGDNFTIISDDEFTAEYIKEIRMFSEKGEFYLWKEYYDFRWRLRIDNEGEQKYNIYEEEHYIWGTRVNNEKILEEIPRGIKIKFPMIINDRTLPFKYLVRNYFKYDNDGLIVFKDARLVKIMDNDGGVING